MVYRIAVLMALLGMFLGGSSAARAAEERADWFPEGSIWTGTGYTRDGKDVERDRANFALVVNSRNAGKFTGELAKLGGGRAQVEGVITASNRVNFRIVKLLKGEPGQGFMDVQFVGRLTDGGRRLDLRGDAPSGDYLTLQMARDDSAKEKK